MNEKYQITILKSAQKDIRQLQKPVVSKVVEAIWALADNPRPSGREKLTATKNAYRIRVGDHRILYTIEDRIRIVEVYGAKHRREAYD